MHHSAGEHFILPTFEVHDRDASVNLFLGDHRACWEPPVKCFLLFLNKLSFEALDGRISEHVVYIDEAYSLNVDGLTLLVNAVVASLIPLSDHFVLGELKVENIINLFVFSPIDVLLEHYGHFL